MALATPFVDGKIKGMTGGNSAGKGPKKGSGKKGPAKMSKGKC